MKNKINTQNTKNQSFGNNYIDNIDVSRKINFIDLFKKELSKDQCNYNNNNLQP